MKIKGKLAVGGAILGGVMADNCFHASDDNAAITALVFGLLGLGIGFLIEKDYEERKCNNCDFWGKGYNWKEGNCPNCGSGSYEKISQ